MRDQLFDHKIGSVRFYLDQEIRCDTKACFLGRPSNEVVQKMARCARLTADMSAPTKPSPEQQAKLREHPLVMKLSDRSGALTKKLHAKGYRPMSTAAGTADAALYARKKEADARLNSTKTRLRERMLRKSRERHFRSADTRALDAQFPAPTARSVREKSKPRPAATRKFNVRERARLVQLTCSPAGDLSDEEKLALRIRVIEIRAALCRRQEVRHGTPKAKAMTKETDMETGSSDSDPDSSDSDPDSSDNDPDSSDSDPDSSDSDADGQEPGRDAERFPVECKPTQCTFCLGNDRLPYRSRNFAYSKLNKLRDHVEKCHLSKIAPGDPVQCKHPVCMSTNVVLPSEMAFKNHTSTVHKIKLRA